MRPGAALLTSTFERTNLRFSVRTKSSLRDAFAPLVDAKKRGGEVPPTLIYALTTAGVDDIAAFLEMNGASLRVLRGFRTLMRTISEDTREGSKRAWDGAFKCLAAAHPQPLLTDRALP